MKKQHAGVMAGLAVVALSFVTAAPAQAFIGVGTPKYVSCARGEVVGGYIDPPGAGLGEIRFSTTKTSNPYQTNRNANGGLYLYATTTRQSAWIAFVAGTNTTDYGTVCAAAHPTAVAN